MDADKVYFLFSGWIHDKSCFQVEYCFLRSLKVSNSVWENYELNTEVNFLYLIYFKEIVIIKKLGVEMLDLILNILFVKVSLLYLI